MLLLLWIFNLCVCIYMCIVCVFMEMLTHVMSCGGRKYLYQVSHLITLDLCFIHFVFNYSLLDWGILYGFNNVFINDFLTILLLIIFSILTISTEKIFSIISIVLKFKVAFLRHFVNSDFVLGKQIFCRQSSMNW